MTTITITFAVLPLILSAIVYLILGCIIAKKVYNSGHLPPPSEFPIADMIGNSIGVIILIVFWGIGMIWTGIDEMQYNLNDPYYD